jgi:preprotein translocase subunit SecD
VKLKKQQLALGLDLKGGMSAVLQVDLGGLFEVFGRQKQQQCGLPESAG